MDDSDEEYMARAADFTRKLYAESRNLGESRKEEVSTEAGAPSTSELAPEKAPENAENRQVSTEKVSRAPAEKRAAPVVPFRIRIPLEPTSSSSTTDNQAPEAKIPSKTIKHIRLPLPDAAPVAIVPKIRIKEPIRLPFPEIPTDNQKASMASKEQLEPKKCEEMAPESCSAAPDYALLGNPSRRIPKIPTDNQKASKGSEEPKKLKKSKEMAPESCSAAPDDALLGYPSRRIPKIPQEASIVPEEPKKLKKSGEMASESCSAGPDHALLGNPSRRIPKIQTDNQKASMVSEEPKKLKKCEEMATVAPIRLQTPESCSAAPRILTDNQKASMVSEEHQTLNKSRELAPGSCSIAQKASMAPEEPKKLKKCEELAPESCSAAPDNALIGNPSRRIPKILTEKLKKSEKMAPESCSIALNQVVELPTPPALPNSPPSRQTEFEENIHSASTPKGSSTVPQEPPVILPSKSEPKRLQERLNNRQTVHVKSIDIPKIPVDNQRNSMASGAEIPQDRPVVNQLITYVTRNSDQNFLDILEPRLPRNRPVPPPEARKNHPLDRLEGCSRPPPPQPPRKQPAPPRAPCVQRPLMRSMRQPAQEQPSVPAPPPPKNPRQHRPSNIIPVQVRQITPRGPLRASQQTKPPVVENRPSETALGRHVPTRTNMMAVESRVMPILGTSSPANDQSTWVEEVPSAVSPITDNSPFDPNESILAASSSLDPSVIEPLDPERHEYPPMFTALTREFAERDRRDLENQNQQEARRTVSVLNLNGDVVHLNLNARPDNNTPDLSPYMMANYRGSFDESVYRAPDIEQPRMSVEPRRRLLPPIAKGKLSTNPVVQVAAAVAVVDPVGMGSGQGNSNVHHQLTDLESVPLSIEPLRSSTPQSVETIESPSEDSSYLSNLTPEDLVDKSEKEILDLTNQFYYSGPYQKFRANYPFLAEGIVQKDCETGELRVYSQRVGKIMIQDTRQKRDDDYVYFIVVSPGVYRGFSFYKHPSCLISAKFPKLDQIVLRGYAILAHPVGSREESMKDNHWVCWNDSLGVMSIIKGSALIPFKKYPVWDKQLDIISFKAGFHNHRFVVEQIVVLTHLKEKQTHFPQEAFLVTDARWSGDNDVDLEFYSNTVKAPIYIKKMLVGTVDYNENRAFELVVVPTFPGATNPQFRGLLIISMSCTFWSKDKEWIRKRLVDRAQAYRC